MEIIIIDDLEHASKETIDYRLSICNTCEKKTEFETCGECNCVLERRTLYLDSFCPIQKW